MEMSQNFDQRLGLLVFCLCRCLQLDLGAFAAADSQQLWSQHLWPAPQAPGRHGASARDWHYGGRAKKLRFQQV